MIRCDLLDQLAFFSYRSAVVSYSRTYICKYLLPYLFNVLTFPLQTLKLESWSVVVWHSCLRYTMFGAWFTYVLLTLSCLPAVSVSIRSDFHTLIRPYTYTSRGEWGFVDWCPFGTYAYAFNLKFEKPQGKIGDDTALNGIRLDCRYV